MKKGLKEVNRVDSSSKGKGFGKPQPQKVDNWRSLLEMVGGKGAAIAWCEQMGIDPDEFDTFLEEAQERFGKKAQAKNEEAEPERPFEISETALLESLSNNDLLEMIRSDLESSQAILKALKGRNDVYLAMPPMFFSSAVRSLDEFDKKVALLEEQISKLKTIAK